MARVAKIFTSCSRDYPLRNQGARTIDAERGLVRWVRAWREEELERATTGRARLLHGAFAQHVYHVVKRLRILDAILRFKKPTIDRSFGVNVASAHVVLKLNDASAGPGEPIGVKGCPSRCPPEPPSYPSGLPSRTSSMSLMSNSTQDR